MKGITLPTGVFCELRRMTFLDKIVARRATVGCEDLFEAYVLSRVALFDGKQVMPSDIINMDYADVLCALSHLGQMMTGPVIATDIAGALRDALAVAIKTKPGEPQ